MEKHVTLLGALHIGFNVLGLLAAIIIFSIVVGAGIISGDEEAMAITAIVGTVIACFLFIISVPGIIGGIWLLKYKAWARMLVLILGFLELFNIPFGTALGVYTIWVLMNDQTIKLFNPNYVGRVPDA